VVKGGDHQVHMNLKSGVHNTNEIINVYIESENFLSSQNP